jgi:hypothetical protein
MIELEKCELDAADILFSELEKRVILLGEQVKIELFKTSNFVVYAVAKINGCRIDVNIFTNKYFNFPIENGKFSVSKLIFDKKLISNGWLGTFTNYDVDTCKTLNYEIITTEYTNSVIVICVSLSAELIFSKFISGYRMVETTTLIPIYSSSYVNQPTYGSSLVGGILEITKENTDAFNFFLKKLLAEVVDFNEIKGV